MKLKYIFAVTTCLLGYLSKAQNFNKGTISAHANVGIEVYQTTFTEHYHFSNLDTTIIDKDTSGNKNICFGADYAVINRLSVGARVKLNTFFVEEDSYTKTTPIVKSQDYLIFANYHLVDRKIFDFSAGIGFGGSNFKYNDNYKNSAHPDGTILKGKGPYFQIQFSPQFIIKQRVGIGMSYYRAFVNYKNMTYNDPQINEDLTSNWKGSGFGLSFNVNVLITKSK